MIGDFVQEVNEKGCPKILVFSGVNGVYLLSCSVFFCPIKEGKNKRHFALVNFNKWGLGKSWDRSELGNSSDCFSSKMTSLHGGTACDILLGQGMGDRKQGTLLLSVLSGQTSSLSARSQSRLVGRE